MNILEILKTKPFGTQLWSPAFGDVRLDEIDEYSKSPIRLRLQNYDSGLTRRTCLTCAGRYDTLDGAECILFPSKQMRNWDKFTFKKGDVLHVGGEKFIIFERYDDNGTYSRVRGKYRYDKSDNEVIRDVIVHTSKCEAADAISASLVRASIEMLYGGKLNPETLEIERTMPEFKDGDIVYVKAEDGSRIIAISEKSTGRGRVAIHAAYGFGEGEEKLVYHNCEALRIGQDAEVRLATDEEKKLLFSKLAGIGKRWNPDTKQLEPLSKKHELKPFDKVLVRENDDEKWAPDFYGYYDSNDDDDYRYRCCGDTYWPQCIPYEGNEHLLGTTNSPE